MPSLSICSWSNLMVCANELYSRQSLTQVPLKVAMDTTCAGALQQCTTHNSLKAFSLSTLAQRITLIKCHCDFSRSCGYVHWLEQLLHFSLLMTSLGYIVLVHFLQQNAHSTLPAGTTATGLLYTCQVCVHYSSCCWS